MAGMAADSKSVLVFFPKNKRTLIAHLKLKE